MWRLIERIIDTQIEFTLNLKNLDAVKIINIHSFNENMRTSTKLAQLTKSKIEDTLADLLRDVFCLLYTSMEQIRLGNFAGAAQILMDVNPMPMVTSRVCAHFCQGECNQNSAGDSVSSRNVERYVGVVSYTHLDVYKRQVILGITWTNPSVHDSPTSALPQTETPTARLYLPSSETHVGVFQPFQRSLQRNFLAASSIASS